MFYSTCRVCLCNGDNMFSLFNSYHDISLSDKIMAFSCVQISAEDDLPTDICSSCVNRVNESYSFKLQCEDSDAVLRKKLRKNITRSNILSPIKSELNIDWKAKSRSVECQVPHDYVNDEIEIKLEDIKEQCSKNVKLEVLTDVKTPSKDDTFTEAPLENESLVKSECENDRDNNSEEIPSSVKRKSLRKRPRKRKLADEDYLFESDESGKKPTKRKKSLSKQTKPTVSKNLSKTEKEAMKVPCTICGKFSANNLALRHHMIRHGEKKIKCNYCEKLFFTSTTRNLHERVHTKEKPLLCNFCGKSFATMCILIAHRRVHTGERPYKCTLCPSTFKLNGQLNYHMKVHLGQKNVKCTGCDKAFINPHDLKNHMITHTGERNFVCSVCDKSFTRNHHLKLHMITHTGERPYKCDICNQGFIQRGYWKQHMNKHNSNEITAQHTENKTVPDNDKVDYNTNFEKI